MKDVYQKTLTHYLLSFIYIEKERTHSDMFIKLACPHLFQAGSTVVEESLRRVKNFLERVFLWDKTTTQLSGMELNENRLNETLILH